MMEHEILRRIEQKADLIMAAQDDINNAVTAVNAFLADLSSQVAAIRAQLASGTGTGTGTPADTSALNTAVAQLPAAQAAIDALTAGTPPVTPPPVTVPPVTVPPVTVPPFTPAP